ncbi:MAG: hypothetical protein WD077_14275 [Bacteroidia bacterium]
MIAFNVFSKREFIAGGEQKRLWHRVGIIKLSQSGRMFLQLFHQPDVDYHCIEPEEKQVPTIQLEDEEEESED